MKVELKREIAEMISNLADEQGMTEQEVVHQILEWYFMDNPD